MKWQPAPKTVVKEGLKFGCDDFTHLNFECYLLNYLQPAVQVKSFNLPAGYP